MSKIKQFAGQTVIYGIGSILSKVVYYLLVVVLLTYLLEGRTFEFGIYGELYGYVTVLLILFSLKLDTALFRFGSSEGATKEAFKTCSSMVLLSSISILIVGFLFTDLIAGLIGYENNAYYIRWFSIILALDVFALIPFAKLRLQNRAKLFASLKIFNVVLSSLLIIFFLIIYPKLPDATISWLPSFEFQIDYVFMTNIIASAVLVLLLVYFVGGFSFELSLPLVKKIIPYILPLVIVGMCNNFIQYNGAALIKFLSPQQNMIDRLGDSGIFDSSRRLAGLFALFIGAFNYAAEPFFFNNASPSDREKIYGRICSLFVSIGGLIVISIVMGLDIIQFLVGKDFRESLFIVPILLMAYLFLGIYHNISIWYKLSDKTIWGAYISIIGVLLTLLISIQLIPKYGYSIFAWANLSTYISMVALAYFVGQYLYPIKYPVKKILLTILIISAIVYTSIFVGEAYKGIVKYCFYLTLFSIYCIFIYYMEGRSLFARARKNMY